MLLQWEVNKLKRDPKTASRYRNLITNNNPRSPISEAFRTLRTNLQFASLDNELNTIMVTSATPQEGKSTISANLAVVMAQAGKKTLFIDTDLRKPTVHYTFGVQNREGLTNLLLSNSRIETLVQPSDIPNLDILTSGPIPPNPAELLGSTAMGRIIEESASTYDMVIFDTPPLLAVADAQILASQLDGVLLVISSGKTKQDLAIKAKDLLEKVNAKILGTVLNNRKISDKNFYYYYGN